MQRYLCKVCNRRFRSKRRQRTLLIKDLWREYVFHKQTIAELGELYGKDERTIRGLLYTYQLREKTHHPRAVHLLVDAIYFGERVEGTSWCAVVARDAQRHENLAWFFTDTETTSVYTDLKDAVEDAGYTILSVTGDGFSGIKSAFFGIPYQMCHVHMERIVTKGTTKNPKTEEGQALLALVRTLHQGTDSHTFYVRFKTYMEICKDFLNEKTFNTQTGTWDWTHRPVRQAALSLEHHRKHLFTFEHNKNIPKTTNSLEGHFSHIRRYLGDHRGVSKEHAQKILSTLFLASSVSPDEKLFDQIL